MTIEERLNNIELNQTLLDQRLSDLELKDLDAQISEAEAKLSSLNHRKKQIRDRITQVRGSCLNPCLFFLRAHIVIGGINRD
ncbi:hypothetical protein ACNJ5Y_005087 [Escherichia coli]